VALAGFVPEYSDGVAADSHRLPYCPFGQHERKATTPYQTAIRRAMQPTRAGSFEGGATETPRAPIFSIARDESRRLGVLDETPELK
jgi:hypothetical protein